MYNTAYAYSYFDTFDLSVIGTHIRKNTNLFGFSLAYSYRWPEGRRYFRSEVQKEKGVFLWNFTHLIVPLTCRPVGPRYSRSRIQKEIWYFFLDSAHLIVPLILLFLGTSGRKYKKKKVFFFCTSLTYSYLCVRNLLITWKNISYRQENTALPHSIP